MREQLPSAAVPTTTDHSSQQLPAAAQGAAAPAAQQDVPLSGLGYATFTSSTQPQKRWIAHSIILCQAKRRQAAAAPPAASVEGVGERSTQAEDGGVGESATQGQQQQEEDSSHTCKAISLCSFDLAPLSSDSCAGFKRGERQALHARY